MRNEVPLQSGTGSSSAAIVAGLAASLALQGRPHGSDELIALAAPIEGHPDNVAAAIAGGLHARARRRARRCCAASSRPPGSRSCWSCRTTRSARRSRASRCGPRCRAPTPSTACSAPRCSCTRSRPATSTRCRARSTTGCTSPTARQLTPHVLPPPGAPRPSSAPTAARSRAPGPSTLLWVRADAGRRDRRAGRGARCPTRW